MKRIIASGVGVLALGAFLAYQPVAGSTGGLTLAPATSASSSHQSNDAPVATSSPSSAPQPENSPVATTDVALKATTKRAKSTSGSGGAALQGNSGAQAPSIAGGPGGDDDGERHHKRGHRDEERDDNHDGFGDGPDDDGFEPHDD